MPTADWLQPDNPLFYWYVYFIFGPMFTLGWWGLAGMALLHVLVFAALLWYRRKASRNQPGPAACWVPLVSSSSPTPWLVFWFTEQSGCSFICHFRTIAEQVSSL